MNSDATLPEPPLADGIDVFQKLFWFEFFRMLGKLVETLVHFFVVGQPLHSFSKLVLGALPEQVNLEGVIVQENAKIGAFLQDFAEGQLVPFLSFEEPDHDLIDDAILAIRIADIGFRVGVFLDSGLPFGIEICQDGERDVEAPRAEELDIRAEIRAGNRAHAEAQSVEVHVRIMHLRERR
jgi:hypothetical protein